MTTYLRGSSLTASAFDEAVKNSRCMLSKLLYLTFQQATNYFYTRPGSRALTDINLDTLLLLGTSKTPYDAAMKLIEFGPLSVEARKWATGESHDLTYAGLSTAVIRVLRRLIQQAFVLA